MGFSSWPRTLLRFVPPDPPDRGTPSLGKPSGRREARQPNAGENWRGQIREARATCASCNRCAAGVERPFLPESKCCTHIPFFPNFAVGEILRAGGRGAAIARERIQGLGCLPLGLCPTPGEEARERARGPERFGVDASVVCPFLFKGECSAWGQRPATCASYYCESSFGDNGRSLWLRADAYFGLVETTVAAEALAQRGFLDDEIELSWKWLPGPEPKRALDREAQAAAWLEFGDDREGFFLRAAEIVDGLAREAVWALLGDDGLRRWRDLEGVGQAIVSAQASAAYFAARDAELRATRPT